MAQVEIGGGTTRTLSIDGTTGTTAGDVTQVSGKTLVVIAVLEDVDTGLQITSVTYDGASESLSTGDIARFVPAHDRVAIEVWYLHSPSADAGTVTINIDGLGNLVGAFCFTVANTSILKGRVTDSADPGTSLSVSPNQLADELSIAVYTTREKETISTDTGTEIADFEAANSFQMAVSWIDGTGTVALDSSSVTSVEITMLGFVAEESASEGAILTGITSASVVNNIVQSSSIPVIGVKSFTGIGNINEPPPPGGPEPFLSIPTKFLQPRQPISRDDFEGTNGTSLTTHHASWVNFAQTCEIQSNAADAAASGICMAAWNAVFSNDQYSECVIVADNSDGAVQGGPGVRINDAAGGGDGYIWVTNDSDSNDLFRIDNGSATNLFDASVEHPDLVTPTDGDTMRLEVRGSLITAILNGQFQFSVMDNTYTSGYSGIGLSNIGQNVRINSWKGGNLYPSDQFTFIPFTHAEEDLIILPGKISTAKSLEFDDSFALRVVGGFNWEDSEFPITMGCWFFDQGPSTNDRCMFQIQDSSQPDRYFRLGKGQTARDVRFFCGFDVVTLEVLTSNQYIERTWNNVIGYATSSTARSIALNDGTVSSNVDEQGVPIGIDSISIGWEGDSTPGDPWEGYLAHIFAYRGLITPSQISQFNEGIPPNEIFAHDIGNLFYVPFEGNLKTIGGFNNNTILSTESTSGPVGLQWSGSGPKIRVKPKVPVYMPAPELELLQIPNTIDLIRKEGSCTGFSATSTHVEGVFTLDSYPITMGCWFNATGSSGIDTLMQIQDRSSTTRYFRLFKSNAGLEMAISAHWDSVAQTAATPNSYELNKWNNVVAVFPAIGSRNVTLNNGTAGTDTGSSGTIAGVDDVKFGIQGQAVRTNAWDGAMAHAFIYKGIMTATQITQFDQGIAPDEIFKDNLVNLFYAPLQIDFHTSGGFNSSTNLTSIGEALSFQADHPPVKIKSEGTLIVSYEPSLEPDNIFNLPDPRFELPSMFLPGRKPTGPVVINTEHHMSKGIFACWIFNTSTLPQYDLTGKQAPMVQGGVSNVEFIVGSNGNLQAVFTDSRHLEVPNFEPPDEGTCLVKLKWTSNDSARQRVLGMNDQFEILIAGDDIGQIQNQFFRAGTEHPQSILSLPLDEYKSFVGTWNQASTLRELYLDGVFQESITNTTTDPGQTILSIGRRTGASNSESFKGEIEYIIFKNYVVKEDEALQWHVDPYQFLIPA